MVSVLFMFFIVVSLLLFSSYVVFVKNEKEIKNKFKKTQKTNSLEVYLKLFDAQVHTIAQYGAEL